MAQINHKAVRSLSKLMEAGFDSEKAVLNMTMDDILSLPGITVAEIGMINAIQKAVKSRKDYHIFGRRGDMSSGKVICFTDSRGNPLFSLPDSSFLCLEYGNGDSSCAFCRYHSEEQVEIDGKCRNIRQFAKQMEKNGIRYRPMSEKKRKGVRTHGKI